MEAIVVGLLLVLLTGLFYMILPEQFNMWLAVFLVGVTFHLLSEVSGVNQYYINSHCP